MIVSTCVQLGDSNFTSWIARGIGCTRDAVWDIQRNHDTYQNVMRTSARDLESTRDKVFIVACKPQADFLLELFKGSIDLGQIGQMDSVEALEKEKNQERAEKRHKVNWTDSDAYKATSKTVELARQKVKYAKKHGLDTSEPESTLETLREVMADQKRHFKISQTFQQHVPFP